MIPSNSKKTTMVFWGLGWGGGGHKHFCHISGGGGRVYFSNGIVGGGSSKCLPTT